ncbi:hypothetical protein EYV96_03350 [Dyella terrae]|uniref:Uncharacterized protein n=2 Tax=Dyella TaxID=231454 RepID=A0A4V2NMM2_9GAMM|nr:hypothetical protein EYV96_03350 [Dyella terrae]TCI13857.1 hypothetical protein EZM97_07515 [Dyella soli]
MYASMQELQAKDPVRWRGLSRDQRLQEGAQLARQKTVQDVTRAHANTIRDMETKASQLRKLESYAAGTGKGQGQLAALRQRAIFHAGSKGDLSVEIQRKAVFKDFVRRLGDIGGEGKFFGLVQDAREQNDLMRAIRDEPTGRPEIDAAGATVRKVMDEAFQQMNDVGIHINRLDDWHTPQPWDWTKVGADRGQFVKDAMDAVDLDRYIWPDGRPMKPDEVQKLISKSAETLGTNGSNKRGEKEGSGFSGSVGGSRNAPRQLHFKDANAYMAMMDKYGSADNVFSLLVHHLNGVARDVAAARVFGRDADNFFPQLVEKGFANDALAVSGKSPEKRAKALEKLEDLKKRTLKEWQAMRQPDHPGSMPGWVKVSQAIRGLAGASLLGTSTLSAIPDLQMAVGYTHLLGIAKSKILGNVAEGMKPTAENRKNISRLGIVVDGLEGAANRFGSEELGPHAIRFMNHVVHVGSGLRMWDRGMAHGVSASIMDMLGEHVGKSDYATLDPKTKAYLDSRGVTADHWQTWQLADLDKGQDGTRTMLTPDSIYSIPDEKLQPLAEQRVKARDGTATDAEVARETRNLRSEAAQQLLGTALHEVQIGARGGSGATVADQLMMGLDPGARGTWWHEFCSWMLFLKQTPLGIFKSHMFDVPQGMDDWRSAAVYRAKFMAGSAALGALGLTLKNLVLGQDPEDLFTPKGLGKIAIASGGLGMYGDFMFGDKGDHQNGALAKVLGPGATMLEDALQLAFNARDAGLGAAGVEYEKGNEPIKPEHLAAQGLRMVRNYSTPFMRIWYLKAAFNHMVYNQMMDNLSPGYTARVEQRMAQRNQGSWWAAGDALPNRAPNLKTVVGGP